MNEKHLKVGISFAEALSRIAKFNKNALPEPPKEDVVVPKIIDLFCGCGGFGLGSKQARFEVLIAVDIDKTLQSAYERKIEIISCVEKIVN